MLSPLSTETVFLYNVAVLVYTPIPTYRYSIRAEAPTVPAASALRCGEAGGVGTVGLACAVKLVGT